MNDQTRLRWSSASRSHRGLIRDRNEDACLDLPERGVWAVADGMGGHALGELASHMVIESLHNVRELDDVLQLDADARNKLDSANRQLRIEAAMRDVPVIGTTVVALLARARSCRYLWAGDSRVYLYRNGFLKQLSRDHSQLEEYKSLSKLDRAESIAVPPRNLITRAVGADDILILDGGTLEVRDGDVFLLCSDGLSNAASEHEMAGLLAVAADCRHAADELIDLALEHGGQDNISVVVVRAEDLHGGDRTIVNPAL